MAPLKVEVDRFDGKGDFSLWRQRMRAILVQLKVAKALEGKEKLPATWTEEQKEEAMEMAYSTLILHLGDKVLREVSKEKTAAGVWVKLEQLYMTNTLTNRIYLKGRLFGFKMADDKDLDENLDEFSKIILDLSNIDVEVDDEDQAIMVLNSLPSAYSTFVETMKYARESLSLEEVLAALKSKQIESRSSQSHAEGLLVRGRSDKKNFGNKRFKSKDRYKSHSPHRSGDVKKLKCYLCHKEGHFKRDCPERKKGFQAKKNDHGDAAVVQEGYESAEVLAVTVRDHSKC